MPPQILVVDDEARYLHLLKVNLEAAGYEVKCASNGEEALEVMSSHSPDLVILVLMMPKLDGFGLVHRIRINPKTRDIPVVFITATYVAAEDKEFALNIGATRFIQKPVDLEKLLATITELSNQDAPAALEPLNEFNFYNGYRKRLEVKLDEKNKQITRDELLLGIQTEEGDQFLHASLRRARSEREELKLLLDQVLKQIEKIAKAE